MDSIFHTGKLLFNILWLLKLSYYSKTWCKDQESVQSTTKKGGYIGLGLSVIPFVHLFFHPFVRHNVFVSSQYLEEYFM